MPNPFDQFDANPFDRFDAKGPKTAPAKPRTLMDDAYGALVTFNRNFLPGVDEAADSLQAVSNLVQGRAKSLPEAWSQARGQAGQAEASFAAARPNAAALSRGTGNAAAVAVPMGGAANAFAAPVQVAGRTLPQLGVNAARGATLAAGQSALYAAGDRGSVQDRLSRATAAATDPITLALGAGAGVLATPPGMPKPKKPTAAQTLRDVGVTVTPAQAAGSAFKAVEDQAKRFPIVGPTITSLQNRQIDQLNRAVGLKALEPIGEGIPKTVKPGFEMVEYVDDRLGNVYEDAAQLVPQVQVDQQLIQDLQSISARQVDLADSDAARFVKSLNDKIGRLSGGQTTGSMVKTIHGELGKLQADAAREGKSILSEMFGDARRAILGPLERANPQAGELIRSADEGWRVYSMMNDAASAASASGGTFTPGQLNTQVRRAARGMGSNMAGKGKGPLQDLATAASEIIPDTYGNPGTANAVGLIGGGWGMLTAPGPTMTAGAALTAAATPYFLAGRKVIESLPPQASLSQLQQAQAQLARLAAMDPRVGDLQREVAARLSSAVGVARSGPRPPPPAIPAPPGV
ncbi:MAG: hypothetical protein IM647_11360 [Phenylobacterium sp.]|uniref:hypothetical protein n=1 Tax=Phenylobacterium sp. TaxID=1871053 RepID=UPI0025D0B7C9|nr:hypothetical protein [Phenylobacterium sp.]MCA3549040.1 hypothetical protein [Rhodobacter sp.]MCA6264151.1 hypothetical protein [Phenylobacterium sp.]MCA6281381.1 hypothetical protein [Phenylobacterium sp.]MCA6308367.1 hypothetical protein [Phenylobacterium sp.]MCA6318950.1 hypothetical protein [Phenylobacterium sp.]